AGAGRLSTSGRLARSADTRGADPEHVRGRASRRRRSPGVVLCEPSRAGDAGPRSEQSDLGTLRGFDHRRFDADDRGHHSSRARAPLNDGRRRPKEWNMTIRSIMTESPTCCVRETNLGEVARMMLECDCGEIPVVDANMKPVGVVTDRDIACRAVALGRNPLELTAADCMTSPCVTVEADAEVADCCDVLKQHQLRRIV